jgi:hypothetical protein
VTSNTQISRAQRYRSIRARRLNISTVGRSDHEKAQD